MSEVPQISSPMDSAEQSHKDCMRLLDEYRAWKIELSTLTERIKALEEALAMYLPIDPAGDDDLSRRHRALLEKKL